MPHRSRDLCLSRGAGVEGQQAVLPSRVCGVVMGKRGDMSQATHDTKQCM